MRIHQRLRRLEEHARAAAPPRPEPTLRELARHDPEVLRMLFEIREWCDQHPGQDESEDPECRARYEEIGRRFEAFSASPRPRERP